MQNSKAAKTASTGRGQIVVTAENGALIVRRAVRMAEVAAAVVREGIAVIAVGARKIGGAVQNG